MRIKIKLNSKRKDRVGWRKRWELGVDSKYKEGEEKEQHSKQEAAVSKAGSSATEEKGCNSRGFDLHYLVCPFIFLVKDLLIL